MSRINFTTRPALRRIATGLAAVGMLVMSSGVALLVTATPANAANKVGICHATDSDSNPYVFISVDDDSAKLQGHLMHKLSPNKIWKTAGTFNGVPHAAGDPKGDLIGSFTDDQGVFHLYDGNVTAATCAGSVVASPVAVADVDFTDPSCANKNVVSFDTTGDHVTFAITAGSNTPGTAITVTATADAGSKFSDNSTSQDFHHTYGPAVDLNAAPCATADATATVDFVDPTCANSNTASYTTGGANVTFAITSGSETPSSDIQVTATAAAGHTFGDLTTKKVFTHHYGDAFDLNGPVCKPVSPPAAAADATASAVFVDPTCANSNDASYTTSGENVSFAITSGSKTPGDDISVTATAESGHTFGDGSLTKLFSHHFSAAVDLSGTACTGVAPPVVSTPTLVHAGLVPDLRSAQGRALTAAGMLLLLVAGGLGLVRPARRDSI